MSQSLWHWEVKLAKDNNGKFMGYASAVNKPHSHTYGWIDTNKEDLDGALEYMKNVCDRKSQG